ncbi:capsular polysaccharide biosynthesis protein [Pontibacter aydingkolensis]|uniref:Glycosyltransferase family 61 protein n=1 Tax=Pontibacter aydingkolensis TaxID=1911536 RepID=A0ABS7CTX5_9BACT|nr:glycosyltransferase family 61 protein [Pontibacter aydingkolensis]MBW7467218.1 glycosyltransferase family 61 protein [Pontibacter aydingkolensis]
MSSVDNYSLLNKYRIKRKKPQNYTDGELDFCKYEFEYDTNDVVFKTHQYCSLSYKGIVYKYLFKLDSSTLVHEIFKPKTSTIIHDLLSKKKKFILDNSKYLLVYDEWSSNHYHWLIEVVARLWLIKSKIHEYKIILPNNQYISEVGLQILDLLELKPKAFVFIQPDEIFLFKKLSIVSLPCSTGRINDLIIQNISEAFRRKYDYQLAAAYKKVYITREGAINRKVLNELEVIRVLKSRGFEIIRFEELSLYDQFLLASSTKIMVSIHGAGLVNMLLMPRGAAVLEFRRDKIYHNQCYWHLADSIGLKYFYLFGNPDSDNVIEGKGCNLTIDIDKLLYTIDKIEVS